VEVAGRRLPMSSLAAVALGLLIGADPKAVGVGGGVRSQPVVGGADRVEDDRGGTAQNSDAAALRAAFTSGVIVSIPMGEQNSAAPAINAPLTADRRGATGAAGSSK